VIILHSMDKFDSIAVLDADTGQISWFSRSRPSTLPSGPVRGHIAELQQRTLCLYRREGALHFRVDDEDFELTEGTTVRLVPVSETTNTIMLFRGEDLLFAWTYQRPTIDPPPPIRVARQESMRRLFEASRLSVNAVGPMVLARTPRFQVNRRFTQPRSSIPASVKP
jgi:hypothetical protein